MLISFDRSWPNCAMAWPNLAESWTKFAASWSDDDQIRLGQLIPHSGRDSAKFGKIRPGLAKIRKTLAQTGQAK